MFHTFLRSLALVLILGIGIGIGSQLNLRDQLTAKDADKTKAKQLSPAKLGVVNIAKVLKEFNSANQAGLAISKRRQQYVDEVRPLREDLADLTKRIEAAVTEKVKAELKESALKINRQIEDLDRAAQKELTEMSDRVIVNVYSQIREMISEMAKERGADIVAAYPDGSDEKDHLQPAIAQLKLQTPALTPFFIKPELDFTDDLIDRINKKYPAEKVKAL